MALKRAIIFLGLVAGLSGSGTRAEVLVHRYDVLGRLTKNCLVELGGGQLTTYAHDPADNRQSYISYAVVLAIPANSGVTSPNGRFYFTMQNDGNLVLYDYLNTSAPVALWASGSAGTGASVAALQGDGNLVVSTSSGVPKWASNSATNYCANLSIQNDGNVVIYNIDGTPVWSTGTGGH